MLSCFFSRLNERNKTDKCRHLALAFIGGSCYSKSKFDLLYPSRNRMLILQDLARLTSACKNLARLTSVLQDSCKINIQNLQDSCKINIQTPLKKSQKKRLKNLKYVKKSAK